MRQWDNLKAQFESLEKEREQIENKKQEVANLLKVELRKIIRQQKLLGNIKWVLEVNPGNYELRADAYDDPGVQILREMMAMVDEGRMYYHFDFKLFENDGVLYFSDQDLYISFRSVSDLVEFMKENGIKPELKNLNQKEKELRHKLANIEQVKQELSL